MRRFIYLDTDTLNSYIAQIYDGLVQSEEKEKQTSRDEKNENAHQLSGDAGADLKILGKGIEGKIGYAYSHLKDTSNMELIRDVQTKMLHDNAFDQLVEYLQDKKLLQGEEIGDFIEIYDFGHEKPEKDRLLPCNSHNTHYKNNMYYKTDTYFLRPNFSEAMSLLVT